MKVNFQEFQSQGERNQYLTNRIESKKYADEDVEIQIEALKYMINQIKADYKSGKDIDEAMENVEKYIYNFIVNDIARPTFNDFYIPRTQEYLSKNEQCLKESIEKFIKEKKNYKKIRQQYATGTTENLNENIDIVIASLLNSMENMKLIKSEKFAKLQQKIAEQKLEDEDIDDVFLYISKELKEAVNEYRQSCVKEIMRNPELVYKKLIDNMNNIFDVSTASNFKKNIQPIGSAKFSMESLNTLKMNDFDNVAVKNFIMNPFYSEDKGNNYLIFISEMLQNADSDSLNFVYNKLKEAKGKDPQAKEIIIDIIRENAKGCKQDSLNVMLSHRIEKLIEMQEKIGIIDKYNSINNSRLLDMQLDGLTIETEELKNILKSTNNNCISSVEMGTALSAFYINRSAKIVPAFLRSEFILEKNEIFKKLKDNPDLEFDDLNISTKTVKQNMAQYDGLQDVIKYRCLKGKKTSDIDLEELKHYRAYYEKTYHNFFNDAKNVVASLNYQKYFYLIKDFSMSSLIYTALTNSKNNIVNWGIVLGDTNKDKDKVLLGFDIESLNMPVFLHMNRDNLISILQRITNTSIIQIYEGANDWITSVVRNERLSTKVLYPINKKQRKYLLKSPKTAESRNTIVNHFKWLQNSKLKPRHVKEPGSRLYDLEKRKIIIANQDVSDDNDEQNR